MLDPISLKIKLMHLRDLNTPIITLQYLAQLNAILTPLNEAKKDIELLLKNQVLESGQNVTTGEAAAEIVTGYTIKDWDTKGLENLSKNIPRLLEFRKVTEVAPNVRLSYK